VKCDSKDVVQWIEMHIDEPKDAKFLFQRSVVKRKYQGRRRYFKKCFPLMLAYAMTAHKCQGGTISGPGIIDVLDAFAAGQLYVMLSRFQKRDQIKILHGLSPEDFKPIPL
jgi:ATP-dependent exoDNAse (exonuclease V) alpha subunit